jgi:hypothetical protein
MKELNDPNGVEPVSHPLKTIADAKPHAAASQDFRLRLKEPRGWFPAGSGVRRSRELLSDGAFKLYVSISLDADVKTGCFQATHQELARLLRKSKRIVGVYIRELEAKGVCRVRSAANQHSRTVLEICDEYWPYHRDKAAGCTADEGDEYVRRVRSVFLGLACAGGSFTAADERLARHWKSHGITIEVVENALLMAAMRKYISWFNHGPSTRIATLRYVEPVIDELREQPSWPAGYRQYIERKLRQCEEQWRDRTGATKSAGPDLSAEDATGTWIPNLLAQKGNQQQGH